MSVRSNHFCATVLASVLASTVGCTEAAPGSSEPCESAVQPAAAQTDWSWSDGQGKRRTRADLDDIIALHRRYLEGDPNGAPANLARANLSGARLACALLLGSTLSLADLTGADLAGANLGGATLFGVKLAKANLTKAALVGANLQGATLTGADMSLANLNGTDIGDADLSEVKLSSADLGSLIFEPRIRPAPYQVAGARNIARATYKDNPDALVQLRKAFRDSGFHEQARLVTYALKRREAEQLSAGCAIGSLQLDTCASYLFNRSFFDLPAEYGKNPGRPVKIAMILLAVFSFVYFVLAHRPGPSGLYLVLTRDTSGRSRVQGMQIRPRAVPRARGRYWGRWLKSKWRVLRASLMFSLMSAFNLGFREIDFGRWLRLLMKREYDLKARGWARTISGVQSLVTVYLIALWVLTYFGSPFE